MRVPNWTGVIIFYSGQMSHALLGSNSAPAS